MNMSGQAGEPTLTWALRHATDHKNKGFRRYLTNQRTGEAGEGAERETGDKHEWGSPNKHISWSKTSK